jgi:hypothetical protein
MYEMYRWYVWNESDSTGRELDASVTPLNQPGLSLGVIIVAGR